MDQFDKADANADGFVTLSELLKAPLASFDCADSNHDGILSKAEEAAAMDSCPSKPSEPPNDR